jgi:predicted metal-binding protein
MDAESFDLHLCGTCSGADRWCAGEGRDTLAGAILAALATEPWAARVRLRRFACLGGCRSRGRASIAAPGRWGVAFGGLQPAEAAALCAFIALWLERPAGQVPKAERPAPIHDRIIARLPPPDSAEGLILALPPEDAR